MSKLINIYGRPGVGKSTLALELTAYLKKQGKVAEYVSEYAKELVYSARENSKLASILLEDQLWIFANQYKKIKRVYNCCDYVVCDSPLLLSVLYDNSILTKTFYNFIQECDNSFDEKYDFLLKGNRPYEQRGRVHTEQESLSIENQLIKILPRFKTVYKMEEILKELDNESP